MSRLFCRSALCLTSLFLFSFSAHAGFPRPGSVNRQTLKDKADAAKKKSHCNQYVSAMTKLQKENKQYICKINLTNLKASASALRGWCLRTTIDKSNWDLRKHRSLVERCKVSPRVKHCQAYAFKSLIQVKTNLRLQCGYSGGGWYSSYATHYAWCVGVSEGISNNEAMIRGKAIDKCKETKEKDTYCKQYANSAVSAYKFVVRNQCKASPSLFHGDYEAHYKWCLSVSKGRAAGTTYARGLTAQSCCYGKKCS